MEKLIETARQAMDQAYTPYSEYGVGAALETTGSEIYTGCNIEVANYSNTIHAEEIALSKAVLEGHKEFSALAITSSAQEGNPPCGMCRQSLREFCAPDFPIYVDKGATTASYDLGTLLPDAIDQTDLNTDEKPSQ